MSGNPDKASIWGDADVYVSDNLDAPIPVDENAPFGLDWNLVGLLDGEAGFEESRSRDSTDYFAWGGLLIRTARRNFVLTRKFTCLEENAVTNGLVWPGSATGERSIPVPNHRIKAAFETIDPGAGKKKRVITRKHAEVEDVGTIKDSESELTKLEITLKIYPDADGVLFDVQPDEGQAKLASLSISPQALTVKVNEYKPVTVTATYDDNSTKNVTADAQIVSASTTKATVTRGFVQGKATGTTTLTATFGDKTATSDVTVEAA